jgi:release factor glutamine methyltransferase
MLSLLEVLNRTVDFLEKRGVEQPRLDAELILAHALGLKRLDLYLQFERPLNEQELEAIRPLVKRRSRREPLQYILGEVDFFNLSLKVDSRALIPRPETEELAERLSRAFPSGPSRILDLGCGSGALGLALARAFPEARVTLTDLSAEALTLARENAERLGLVSRIHFFNTSWFAGVDGIFDLVVSNPPYLSAAELSTVAPELARYEPGPALSPGPTGLEALEAILHGARGFMTERGVLALETGVGQHAALEALAEAAGFSRSRGAQDLSGRPRFFLAGGVGAAGVIDGF